MKKWIVRIGLVLLAVFLFIGLVPFSKEICYTGIEYEYSLTDETLAIPHEVVIDGVYNTTLFLKDSFYGTVYVSDVEGLTADMRVNVDFEPNRWHHAYFLDYAGQAHSTEIVKIFFDRNFENLAMQFATKYERDGNTLKIAADNEKSNFLVIGAQNKEEALTEYTRMLQEKQ